MNVKIKFTIKTYCKIVNYDHKTNQTAKYMHSNEWSY